MCLHSVQRNLRNSSGNGSSRCPFGFGDFDHGQRSAPNQAESIEENVRSGLLRFVIIIIYFTMSILLISKFFSGFWFSPEFQFARQCVDMAQKCVNGTVR